MNFAYKSPETDQEWHDYFDLRWQILRAPWQQPRGSERDEWEDTAYHLLALDDHHHVIGVGRLHRRSDSSAQIRYMAVAPELHGQGIGSQLLMMLEAQARAWECRDVVLNARTSCLAFYEKHEYDVIADAPTLFGSIVHKKMRKRLG